MANSRIKGITIELNGDTTGLTDALKDVNKESSKVTSELKEVERALKFDPGNAELIGQKQQLLAEQIQNTTQKLDVLKTAQAQVEEQFKNGDIGAEQYRAFQRELATTEASLKNYETQMRSTAENYTHLKNANKDLETFFAATGTEVNDFADVLGTRLTNAIREGTASTDQINKALQLMGQKALGAGADVEKMKDSLKNINESGLQGVKNEFAKIASEAEEAGDSVNGFGEKLQGVAAGLVAGGGLAVTIQQALDVSSLNTNIEISMGIKGGDAEAVRESINGVTAAIGDEEAAYEGVRRQMTLNKNASIETNQKIIEGASMISRAYKEVDFKELIQESHEIGKELNISQQDALGLVNQLLKVGFPPEQLDIIAEYGAQLQRAGYSAEEVQAIMAAGVDTGTWNIDNLLDGLKEGRIKAAEFGQGVDKAMKEAIKGTNISAEELEKWGQAVAKGGEQGNKAFEDMTKELMAIEDETKRNEIGVKLFGTMWEDQGENIAATILNMENHLKSADDMQKTLNSDTEALKADPAYRMAEAMNSIKQSLAPVLADLAEMVATIADWIAENPKLTASLVAVAGVIGTLVAAFATLMPAISGFVGMVGGGSAALGILGTALGVITGPIGITVAALAGLGVGVYAVTQELSESSIQVEDWSTKVSEGTAKAVGGYLDLEQQATNAMHQLAWGNATITQSIADDMIAKYDQMGQMVLTEMQADHAAQLTEMTNFYAQSNALGEQREAEILDRMREKQLEQQTVVQEGNARIKEIWQTAANEKRGLKESEEAEIDAINVRMKESAIKHLSESERDQKAILETLKTDSSEITAEQAAEVVKNSKKQRDETVKEAEQQYKDSVKNAQMQRDELGIISQEEYEKIVGEAKKTRDDTVKNAQDMHQNVVSEAKAQAGEHVEQVNWETGEVKTKWRMLKEDVGRTIRETVESTIKSFADMYNGVNKWMSDVKTTIEKKWKEAEAFLKGINLVQIGKDIVNGLIKGIGEMFGGVQTKIEELASKIPDWAKKILGIHSPSRVMAEVGMWTGEGLAQGIESTYGRNESAMKELSQLLIDATKDNQAAVTEIANKAEKERTAIQKESAVKKTEIEKKLASDIQAIQSKAAAKKKKLTAEENKRIAKLKEDANDKLLKLDEENQKKFEKINTKAWSDMVKKEESASSERLKIIKQYIADKDSTNELSLATEKHILEESLKLFKDGTAEKIEIQKMYQKVTGEINKESETINKTYVDNVKKLNENYIAQEQKLTKEYEDTLQKRISALYSFSGLFDEVVQKDVSGSALIAALQSQVTAFEDWQKNITELASKGIDEGLLGELRAMGPKAGAEIAALNTLTDEQLQQYVALWKEKNELARTQAEAELTGLRQNTEKQINELKTKTAEQLRIYQNEWRNSMISLKGEVKNEMDEMPSIGEFAVNGLIDGMMSKQGDLLSAVQSLASIVSDAFTSALDIHSPSRVMRGYGINIGEGLVLGINDMVSKVSGATRRLAKAVTDKSNISAPGNTTSSTTTNKTENNTENHYNFTVNSPKPLDPYETSRLSKNALKEMGLQF